MKFSPKQIIDGVKNYDVYNNNLIYSKGGLKNKKLYINDIHISDEVTNYELLKNKLFFNKWKRDNCFVYDTIKKTTTEIKKFRFYGSIEHIIIFKNSYEYIYKNYELKNLFSSEKPFIILEKDFGIFYNDNSIIKKSIANQTLWNLPLSSFGKPAYEFEIDQIDKVLGVNENNLWVLSKGGRLITVSIKTGNIVHKFSTQESDLNFGYETTIKGTSFFVNNSDNNLYCMSANYFQKINTQTYEIEESFNFREADFSGMGTYKNIYSPLLQGNYFSFLGEKLYGDGVRYIGLYDYNRKRLIWEYELISKEDFMNGNKLISPEPVYFSNEKLFVKDFKNNLHILKKEETDLI